MVPIGGVQESADLAFSVQQSAQASILDTLACKFFTAERYTLHLFSQYKTRRRPCFLCRGMPYKSLTSLLIMMSYVNKDKH